MRTMKRIASILCAFAVATPALMAFKSTADSTDIKLYDINVAVDEAAAKVRIDIDLDIEKYSVNSEREIIFTPVIVADNLSDSLALEPIVIAGRNRWFHYLRDGELEDPLTPIYRAGKKNAHAGSPREVPFASWMEQSTVEMRAESANCCDAPDRLTGPSPSGNIPLAHIDVTRPAFNPDFVYAPPVDAGPVIKSLSGSAFITFIVNRTELEPDYMINPQELRKIYNSIQYVKDDKDATITHVHIKGFASPEGPYDNNVRLAKGRTETLRRHVRDLYHFPDTVVTSSYDPEDWAGLRNYLTDSLDFPIEHRREIIDIVDGPLGYDARDREIKVRFPKDYAVILKEIYPWLRHSDYTVEYAIKTYTDINEIRHAFETDPTRLRNVDFYTLAQTFPEGSDEYCNVFETAVEVYPDDPMLNLNAANNDMKRGQLDEAQSHLLKAGNTPEAHYARAILAAKRSDFTEAVKRFKAAADAGMTGCDTLINQIGEINTYHPVTYLISPSSK